jgi:class 3 adenylate cyclase/tetratricopeptide (TPR) repeat protein
MFSDIVGFSGEAQRDEGRALRHVDEQRAIVRPLFDRYGGREVKTMGDGILTEFDSALHATECAVEMQRRMFERNRDARGDRFEMRIGVHVGDVVHSDNDVYGDAVNIASRIEPLAEAGGVCVTGPVFEQVQNKIRHPFRPIDRPFLKHIDSVVQVYRLELPWTPPSLAEAAPFTDRETELERLRAARRHLEQGDGAAVAIQGESGVGKSRLIAEFIARAERDGIQVIRGRGDGGGISQPFGPWAEAVRDFAREAPGPLLYKACEGCAAEVGELVPELRSRLGPGREPSPAAASSQQRLFEGILRFLDNLAQEAPLIVVLDDFHGADTASIDLLEFVARRLSGRRLLVLAAYREAEGATIARLDRLLTDLEREQRLERLSLRRFDAPTSELLVRQMLRGGPPARGGKLNAFLFEKSGGNPMILEAVVRSLVSDGALVWTEDGWTSKSEIDIRLPPVIESLVRRRLGELDRSTVDILRLASVFGPQFSFEALRRLAGLPPEELLSRLEEALRFRILEERAVGSGRSIYTFSERPVVDALYAEISLVRRTRFHAEAARALESVVADGGIVPSAELAHHYLRASDYAPALRYTLRAAEDASRLFAREEAIRQLTVALELLESRPDDRVRAEVLYQLGTELDLLGRHTEAYRSQCEAAELYGRLGMDRAAGNVHRELARRSGVSNEMVRAMDHLEKARRLLETGPASVELANLYSTRGIILFQQVRLAEARESFHRALELAVRLGAPRVESSARMMLASIAPLHDSAAVWEHLDRALVLARADDDRRLVANVMMLQAAAFVNLRGDGRAALRATEDALEYVRKGNDPIYEMGVKGGMVTYIEWRLGDLELAERAALEYRAFAKGDPRRERPTAITVLAEVALARGEIDRAEKLLWEAERLQVEGGDWTETVQTETALARCALRRGKPTLATDHLRRAHALGRKAGPPAMDALYQMETLALLVRSQIDAGTPEAAEPYFEELVGLSQALGAEAGAALRTRAEGWLFSARSSIPAAIASLEAAVGHWQRVGWRYEWAQTVLDLATVHEGSGAIAEATALRDQASEYLSKAGARRDPPSAGAIDRSG